jgi:metal-responsive CopG/Arc/MetJ family transcriptional regulator
MPVKRTSMTIPELILDEIDKVKGHLSRSAASSILLEDALKTNKGKTLKNRSKDHV